MPELTWTKEYCGYQNLGKMGKGETWVSVQTLNDTFVLLSVWYPGCGFNPITTQFNSVQAAKIEGELIMIEKTMSSIWRMNSNGQAEIIKQGIISDKEI